MTTTETTLVIILTTLLSLFIIMCIAVTVGVYKLVKSAQRVVERAEDFVDSVEAAAEILRDTSGRMAIFKLVRNIIKVVGKKGRK